MRWKGRRQSRNVVDRRSLSGRSMDLGGLLIGALVVYLMGGDPLLFLTQNMDQVQPGTSSKSASTGSQQEEDSKAFVAVVLADTEDVWTSEFGKSSEHYEAPKLVLCRGRVDSTCGMANSASGPFYFPLDHQVYLDLTFFDELSTRLGARGDFAGAYVVAHEVGHHIQNITGVLQARRHGDNPQLVQIELPADCLAGVWARQTEQAGVLEDGDIDGALGAAAAVWDDRLQKQAQGYVVPDSFTHGTSAERANAFRKGNTGGRLDSCKI
ncbi:MAG: neutral zinc metallopeptidase [Bdellovibrionales bacterium]